MRRQVSRAHTLNARAHGEAGRFDEARTEFEAALATLEGGDRFIVLAKWAACEFKADNTARAEELLTEARSEPGRNLALGFLLVMEAVRLKLPRPLKARFDADFAAALAATPTAEEAVAALNAAGSHRDAKIAYRGQKSHEKKLMDYLGRVAKPSFTEAHLEQACGALIALKDFIAARKYTALGTKRFRRNPHFPFLEAQTYLLGPKKRRSPPWQVNSLLMDAERLARGPPPGRARSPFAGRHSRRTRNTRYPGQPLRLLGNIFDRMFEEEDDDDGNW